MKITLKITALLGLALMTFGACAQSTTQTYTGVIKDLSQQLVTSGQVSFTLAPPTDSTVPGLGRLVPFTINCNINADGTLSGYVAGVVSGACIVTPNTAISPTGTSYRICIQPQFQTPGSCFYDYALGGTKDISTIAPTLSTGPVNYAGTIGPTGNTGPPGPIGGSLSYPGVTTDSANGLLILGGATLGKPINEVAEQLTGTDASAVNVAGSTIYTHIWDRSVFALAPIPSGLGSQGQSYQTVTAYGPGLNLGNSGGGRTVAGDVRAGLFMERGISQMYGSNATKHATGDFQSIYTYAYSDGGCSALSDECIGLANFSGGETSGYYVGSITSTTGTGDIAPGLAATGPTTDGSMMLDITKGTITGSYAGAPVSFGGTYLGQQPVSNTLPISSAWGTMTAGIPNPSVTPNNSASLTTTINLTAGGVASTGSFAVGIVCITGPNYPEQARITAVGAASGGTQSITFSYHNSNNFGGTLPILMQGGVCGQYISEDANFAFSGFRTSIYAFGSITGTSLINGINAAGHVTPEPFNGRYQAQTTTSAYHLFPGAEVVENTNATSAPAPILEPNTVPWAVGDAVENPHFPEVKANGLKIDVYLNSPANATSSGGQNTFLHGHGVAGANVFGYIMRNSNPSSYYTDFSGPVDPPYCGFCTQGYWNNPIDIGVGPPVGGSVILLENSEKGDATAFNIFLLHNGTGAGATFGYNPATSAFTFNRNLSLGCATGQLIKGDGTGCGQGSPLSAILTTTAATSDTITLTGMTTGGKCSLDPTNAAAIAATQAGVTNKSTNSVTVTHAATAGMTYDLVCTTY